MILRFDPKSGNAAILSIPRDLWVPIAGTTESNRINSAYTKGNDVLINTVEQNFGIPINHFIDVDFYGFKDLVDALGGVTVYFDLPTRDKNTGLRVTQPGCVTLNGIDALAYVRSRHFSQEINGKWKEDQSSDFGRISRQQDFIRRAATKAFASANEQPARRLVAREGGPQVRAPGRLAQPDRAGRSPRRAGHLADRDVHAAGLPGPRG